MTPQFQLNHIYQATDSSNYYNYNFIFKVTSVTLSFIVYVVIAGTPIHEDHYSDSFHINSHLTACSTFICNADDLHLYPELFI